jgi:hypothetical protein
MQRLLNFYRWDADAVRDDLRGYVLNQLGDPAGVVVADETGFLKKGVHSAGVQRQYSGTAGRIENCQLGVFLTYTSPRGRALIDRELYLPKTWTEDHERCAGAGIGPDVEFATKPALARKMLERLLATHGRQAVPWFTADEADGDNPRLRDWLDAQAINYVMAISCDARFPTPTGPRRADELAASAPKRGWQRLSCGKGSKGHRLYDWLLIDPGADDHLLLVRRSISKPSELAYYLCRSSVPVPLAELVRVAGSRWGVERNLPVRQERDRPGPLPSPPPRRLVPAHHPVHARRRVPRRHRPHRTIPRPKRGTTSTDEQLIPLSCNEIRRLWATLTHPDHPCHHTSHWSHWRRTHQTRAKQSHYQRQRLKHHKVRLPY